MLDPDLMQYMSNGRQQGATEGNADSLANDSTTETGPGKDPDIKIGF